MVVRRVSNQANVKKAVIDARLAQTAKLKHVEVKKNKNYLELVEAYQVKWGVSRSEALRQAMISNPKAHREYIESCNPSMKNQIKNESSKSVLRGADFIGLVKAAKISTGCSTDEAMIKIRSIFPDAHKAYLEKENRKIKEKVRD